MTITKNSKKLNYVSLNKKLLKPGKLYKHTKEYNNWYFKKNTVENNHIFFLSGETFDVIGVGENQILMFISYEIMPNFSEKIGLNCIFLYGKMLIEGYYDNDSLCQMLIFEKV